MSSYEHDDRREFLKTCGKFAAVTPPAVTMLMSTSTRSQRLAGRARGPTNTIITNTVRLAEGRSGARLAAPSLLATKSVGNVLRVEP
ncbi:hypothetical protein ACNJYD_21325 [Bradyrhizobium sp. DASA03005]|uniref:hypothetical protein n=1 Tax=Bradyrhizobium sp. SPXBL-02 TaxID=3395912 RepID=UPI003F6E48DA